MADWRQAHGKVILQFLSFLNSASKSYILKGGTALVMCYNLDRFSEDIDLDGFSNNIIELVNVFCKQNGYTYRIAKDTATVKRCMVNYGNEQKPLKIEVSYRQHLRNTNKETYINGILVYTVNTMCLLKCNAYSQRDKIRDLYDVAYLCNTFFNNLSSDTITVLQDAIGFKGLEQFDYLISQQQDELIDKGKLETMVLIMFEKLGLLGGTTTLKPLKFE